MEMLSSCHSLLDDSYMDCAADLAKENAVATLSKIQGAAAAENALSPVVLNFKMDMEKRERGTFRGAWVPYTFTLAAADGQLKYCKAGSAEILGSINVASITKVKVLPLTDGKPICLELVTAKATWILSLPTSQDVDVVTTVVAASQKQHNSSFIAREAASEAAEVLPNAYDELNKSLAGDVDGVMQAGESFLAESFLTIKDTATEVAGALFPILLEIAHDVPFFAPIAGVLLLCHSSYVNMGKIKENLVGLEARLDYATRLIKQVATDKKDLFLEDAASAIDSEMREKKEMFLQVIMELKILTVAVQGTTLVINKIKRFLDTSDQKMLTKVKVGLTAMVLQAGQKKLIDDALEKLTAAISGFVTSLQHYTSMELQQDLNKLKEQLGGMDAKLDDLTTGVAELKASNERLEASIGGLEAKIAENTKLLEKFAAGTVKSEDAPLAMRGTEQHERWRETLPPEDAKLVKDLENWLRDKPCMVFGKKCVIYANLFYEEWKIDRPEKIKEELQKEMAFLDLIAIGLPEEHRLSPAEKGRVVLACFSDVQSTFYRNYAKMQGLIAERGGLDGMKKQAQEKVLSAVGNAILSIGAKVSETVSASPTAQKVAEKISPTVTKLLIPFGSIISSGNSASVPASPSPTVPSSPQPSTPSPRAAAAAAAAATITTAYSSS